MELPALLQHKKLDNYVDGDYIYVEGVLKMVLRCCRVAGVAPFRTSCVGASGWRAVLSPPLVTLQAIAMTLLNIAAVVGVILDLLQKPEKRVRVGDSFVKAFIWISDLALLMIIPSITTYSAGTQMECLQRVLTQMQQVKLDLNMNASPTRTEKIKSIAMLSWLVFVTFVVITDFTSFIGKSVRNESMWIIMPLYSCFYIANIQGVLLVMRWSLTAQAVQSAAAAINMHLEWLLQVNIKPEPNTNLQDVGSTKYLTLVDFRKQTKTSSKTIKMGSGYSMYPSQVQAIIRRLALSHESVGEMMRQLNDSNGPILLAILMTTFLRLVLTPYYMLARLFRDEHFALFKEFLPFGWGLILMTNLILTIEPCHRTHLERDRTGILLSQMIVHVAPKCHRVSNVLDQFAKQIVLSDAKFMPLGVYVLSRSLMVTMLGSVTTYLLIILQFEAVSQQL